MTAEDLPHPLEQMAAALLSGYPGQAWAHVESAPCTACDWSGLHWHWGERRFRSVRELRPEDVEPFDRALGYPRPAGGSR